MWVGVDTMHLGAWTLRVLVVKVGGRGGRIQQTVCTKIYRYRVHRGGIEGIPCGSCGRAASTPQSMKVHAFKLAPRSGWALGLEFQVSKTGFGCCCWGASVFRGQCGTDLVGGPTKTHKEPTNHDFWKTWAQIS